MNERLTLAEIDAQCRRAARGAGYAWGLAEEAGKAARWLASYGMPGPEALAALLSGSCPRSGNRAEEGAGLCSLSLGASLSDRATQIADGRGFVARDVAYPLLLLPQAGRAATALETVFVCAWEGFRVVCMPGGIAIDRAEALNPARVDLVECHLGTAEPVLIRPGIGARLVAPAAWEALDRLARNTYVPATAASRQAGAGAGLSDND